MERWKQRNSLNLDTRAGLYYLGRIFSTGGNHANNKDVIHTDHLTVNGNSRNSHYAGLQPLSPCWELSDSFTHSKSVSQETSEEKDQITKLRTKNPRSATPKRPYSICGPISESHRRNFSVPSPAQVEGNVNLSLLVQLRKKTNYPQKRCFY